MPDTPTPEEKTAAFDTFRSDLEKAVDKGMEDHESKMTKMGFLFLGIFIGVITLAAVLPELSSPLNSLQKKPRAGSTGSRLGVVTAEGGAQTAAF